MSLWWRRPFSNAIAKDRRKRRALKQTTYDVEFWFTVAPFGGDCHVWAIWLRHAQQAALLRLIGTTITSRYPTWQADWQRKTHCARTHTHTHTLRGSVQRFGCKLWSSARETFGGRERGGSMFSLRCTWIPQIIRGSRLGAHWDDRVIGTFLICLSSRCDRADKLADPESFVALGAGFLPPSEENKDDSAYLLIYSLLSLKNQQTLAVPGSKNAK